MPSELREALLAAQAAPLINKVIDPVLLELQRRYSPLVRSLPSVQWQSDVYYFNTRNQVATGGFVPDGGAQPVSNSVYMQNSFAIKHLQVVGAVTGYAQEVTRQLIGDLRRTEIEGSIRGLYWDIETAILWGNAASTLTGPRAQFDGLDTQVGTYSGGYQNAVDENDATMTLAMLDELIDMVETNVAMSVFSNEWMFLMSSTANSKVAGLLTNQQRFQDKTEVAAGLIVPTYRDIPIVKSSFLGTRGYSVGTVSSATATTGGTLQAGTYYYKVTAVMARQGEIAASAEVSQTTSGTTSTVTLSLPSQTGLDGSQPISYKVYRSTGAGTETLLGYVDAVVGLSGDGVTPIPTTSIVDTGTALVPQNGGTVPNPLPQTYYGKNDNAKPVATGSESIYLISRDRNNIVRPYVRDVRPLDVYPTTTSPDTLPYALVSDTTLAVRAPRYTGRLARVGVSL